VGPDSIVLPYPTPSHPGLKPEVESESEIWFDWAFVDFWKSNYCVSCVFLFLSSDVIVSDNRMRSDSVQRGFSTDPESLSSTSGEYFFRSSYRVVTEYPRVGQNVEAAMLVASLRDAIRSQSQEIEDLKKQLREKEKTTGGNDDVGLITVPIVSSLTAHSTAGRVTNSDHIVIHRVAQF
jgi:intracellular protein transport protein USO1